MQILNRKAHFNYEITEEIEAGMILLGSEVKSLLGNRATWLRVDLSPSVCPIKSRQWLMPCFRQILRIPKKMTDLIRHGNPTGNRQYRNQKNIYSNLVLFLCPPCLFFYRPFTGALGMYRKVESA